MVEVCVTWSTAGDKEITGLCPMELLMETARTMRDGCPICATPVAQETGDPAVAGACVTWFIPFQFVTGLCSMKFAPREGNVSCSVCATPVSWWTSDTYDSGSGTWISPITGNVTIEGWGGGGGGGFGGDGAGSNGASGGGGGGYFSKTIAVTIGQSISYVVGVGGAGALSDVVQVGGPGGDSSANSGAYVANGGDGGDYGNNDPSVAAAGGTASGGDTNTTGGSSPAVTVGNDGGVGGDAAGTGGGVGGNGELIGPPLVAVQDGAAPGGGGGGGGGFGTGGAPPPPPPDGFGGNGANGRIKFTRA